MKTNNNFIFRTIANEHLLIPVGEAAVHTKGLIALSESGALLYRRLQGGCAQDDLIAALTAEYNVSEEEAARDIETFLDQMRQLNMLEE